MLYNEGGHSLYCSHGEAVACQVVEYYITRECARVWLGSRVVSVLDSGAEGPGSNRSRDAVGCLSGTVHTHRASVHQAAKLVAALLRVAEVTAGLAE